MVTKKVNETLQKSFNDESEELKKIKKVSHFSNFQNHHTKSFINANFTDSRYV